MFKLGMPLEPIFYRNILYTLPALGMHKVSVKFSKTSVHYYYYFITYWLKIDVYLEHNKFQKQNQKVLLRILLSLKWIVTASNIVFIFDWEIHDVGHLCGSKWPETVVTFEVWNFPVQNAKTGIKAVLIPVII